MMPSSIYRFTRLEYAQYVHQALGKGQQHAHAVYQQWIQKGRLFPDLPLLATAPDLYQQILSLTDFTPLFPGKEQRDESTAKFLLRTHDALETESVLIPMQSGWTLCVSSQVGCRMGCAFCETGKMGLLRHLRCEEIVYQLHYALHERKVPVRSVVFMGMGEPFDNYEEVLRAVRVMSDTGAYNLGARKITLSTSGKAEGILRLAREHDLPVNLAVSVNAPSDEVRKKIMPITRKVPLAELRAAMEEYATRTGRQLFIEYVLLKEVNDRPEDALALAHYLEGLPAKVNVIPYNSQRQARFQTPNEERIDAFIATLRRTGMHVLLRANKGNQVMAACGQLGNAKKRATLPLR